MEEILRTNDMVLISFAETLLRDAGMAPLVVDQNMSVVEGSLGVLPRRIMVPASNAAASRALLEEAGIGGELSRSGKRT